MKIKVINILVVLLLISVVGVGYFIVDSMIPSKSETLEMLFSYPDGSICESACLLGIQPRITTTAQANSLLSSHPLTRDIPIRLTQHGDMNYLNVTLQNNGLHVKVNPNNDIVSEVELDGDSISGTGTIGININGFWFTWNDLHSYLGEPGLIIPTAGDGGHITRTSAIYKEGWCVNAKPANSFNLTTVILPDERVLSVDVNCYTYQNMEW